MPAESVSHRVATARGFVGKLWKLSAPYWWAEEVSDSRILGLRLVLREKWIARGLLAMVIILLVLDVYVSKLFNDWYGRFYNALEVKDSAVYWVELQYFTILAFISIIIDVYRFWLRQFLIIRWRRWLTGVYTDAWLSHRTYYQMELAKDGADNPEQRIEQDVKDFTERTLVLTLDLLSNLLTLFTFTFILWGLSGPITLPIFGGITIPGYMMWAAILYAVAGSYLTYLFGRPLVRVNFDLERYNADFRYRMVRVRENAESIALYNGEPDEGRRLDRAFGRIYDAYWQYMRYTKRLIWLQSFYGQAAIVFPFFVAAPRYFSGQIQLGTLMQISSAFGTVQRSLSWFVNTYTSLADWKAMMDRLTTFSESMESTRREALGKSRELKIETQPRRELALDDLQLLLPDGRVLLDDVDLQVQAGDRLVLQGPSGSGKTTLFRALSGLWPFGRGRVRVPAGARMLFLPQRPYTPIGTLREAVCYPDKPERHDDAAITEALAAARVGHLASRLDETANWSMILSGGEQQRLAFARAILVRPDWLFLDEATSALDEAGEAALYGLVRERLPKATLISIAHRPGVARFHDSRLRIDPATRRVTREPLEAAAPPA